MNNRANVPPAWNRLVNKAEHVRDTKAHANPNTPISDSMAQLEALHALVRDANLIIKNTVEVARENNVTWSDLGEALHVSKQAAQQRYGNR